MNAKEGRLVGYFKLLQLILSGERDMCHSPLRSYRHVPLARIAHWDRLGAVPSREIPAH